MKALLYLGAAVCAMGAALAQDHHVMAENTKPVHPQDMSSMNMKMVMPPMPMIYAGVPEKPGAPLFEGYGNHHHPISSKNAKTQVYFDQGIRLLFAFNHAEAIRSFREAARLDPNCAMCWWGVSYALGSNINLPMQPDAIAPAWTALQMALARKPHASAEERAWIDALAMRYSQDPKADRHALDEAYAAAMGIVWKTYPNNLDAGVFYAEALMDTQPWDYWQEDHKTPKGHGGEIVGTLESVLKREPLHPGALHFYIHAVEASTTPERAEAVADRLETQMPSAGHIVHMPAHIYFRVGRYEDAVKVNELAAQKDEQYIAACKAQGFYPLGYYSHNLHFLWTSSEMLGRYQAAQDAGKRVLTASGGAPFVQYPVLQLYQFVPVTTELRFGQWDKVLAAPAAPDDQKVYKSVALYARGFAFANKGDLAGARSERARLAAMLDKKEFAEADAFGVPATQMAQLGLWLLDGEIGRHEGKLDQAIADFRKAQDAEYALPYTEPAYWHQPVSHVLGAALIQAAKPAEAEAVYRESLKNYRTDGWALFGLAQALDAQGKKKEADAVRADFAKAWRLADVKLASSRF